MVFDDFDRAIEYYQKHHEEPWALGTVGYVG
jgi:hypothetical protein